MAGKSKVRQNKKYRRGVFIVIYRKTKTILGKEKIKYLLLKRKLHWSGWEFCKGGVEKGEKLIEVAKREVKEETGQKGFNFYDYKISGKYLYQKELKDRPGIFGQTYHLFSCEVKESKVKLDSHEHNGYRWFLFNSAIKKLKWEDQKNCLKKVDKWLKK